MTSKLASGDYPFIDRAVPLSDMVMVEAPRELEDLFRAQAAANGIEIIRDAAVELTCQTPDGVNPTFLIYWPAGQDRIHMLVPKRHAEGRA